MTTLWTYPWDVVDTGPERAAKEIAQTGLRSVSLAATYHAFDMLRPHRTENRLLKVDSSAAYYPFDPGAFSSGTLTPKRSTLVSGAQWSECSAAAQQEGLGVVAWTIFLHNSYLAGRHPDLSQVTCSGEHLDHQLCPVQTQVQRYAQSLASDICNSANVNVLECEGLSFGGFGHTHYHPKIGIDMGRGGRYLFSLCLCEACISEAKSVDIDVEAVRSRTRESVEAIFLSGQPILESPEHLIDEDPDLAAFAKFRDTAVTRLVKSVAEAARKPIRILAMGDRHTTGLDIPAIAPMVDSVEYLCYTSDPDRIGQIIEIAAQETGSAERVGVGLQAYPPASPNLETLRTSVSKARDCGAGLISFYNYGIMPKRNLGWIAQSLGQGS